MRRTMITTILAAILGATGAIAAPPLDPAADLPAAIYTDPPHDTASPARMEVLHIPSGGVAINGVAYVAAGKGPHPTLVLLHGLPGNEKNLDLAQAVRRAGWTVITFNYRGSWGSPGLYSFVHTGEDADAVLDFVHRPEVIAKLGIDPARIVIGGHSLGGWVTARTAAHRKDLAGAILISAADMAAIADRPRPEAIAMMADNMESLQGVTPETMTDEIARNAAAFRLADTAKGLARTPLLVLSSDDGLAPGTDNLIALTRAAGNGRVTAVHADTDHGWSDRRVGLQSAVIRWLEALR